MIAIFKPSDSQKDVEEILASFPQGLLVNSLVELEEVDRKESVSAIVMPLRLFGGASGLTMVNAIRSLNSAMNSIPIALALGSKEQAVLSTAFSAGVDRIISPPYSGYFFRLELESFSRLGERLMQNRRLSEVVRLNELEKVAKLIELFPIGAALFSTRGEVLSLNQKLKTSLKLDLATSEQGRNECLSQFASVLNSVKSSGQKKAFEVSVITANKLRFKSLLTIELVNLESLSDSIFLLCLQDLTDFRLLAKTFGHYEKLVSELLRRISRELSHSSNNSSLRNSIGLAIELLDGCIDTSISIGVSEFKDWILLLSPKDCFLLITELLMFSARVAGASGKVQISAGVFDARGEKCSISFVAKHKLGESVDRDSPPTRVRLGTLFSAAGFSTSGSNASLESLKGSDTGTSFEVPSALVAASELAGRLGLSIQHSSNNEGETIVINAPLAFEHSS